MKHQSEGGDTADVKPGASTDAVAELGEHHCGQVRIAYRLARSHADKLLYVNGIGWHFWDVRRWAPDDRGVAPRAVLDETMNSSRTIPGTVAPNRGRAAAVPSGRTLGRRRCRSSPIWRTPRTSFRYRQVRDSAQRS